MKNKNARLKNNNIKNSFNSKQLIKFKKHFKKKEQDKEHLSRNKQ